VGGDDLRMSSITVPPQAAMLMPDFKASSNVEMGKLDTITVKFDVKLA